MLLFSKLRRDEEVDLSWSVTVPPAVMVWIESPPRRADLSVGLKPAETQPLAVASTMPCKLHGSCPPLHGVSCFCTILLWVHFFLEVPRHLKGQQLLQWICSYLVWLCWLKQRCAPVTSAKSSHFLLSKAQESRVSVSSWGLPWLPTNFVKRAGRVGQRDNWGHYP